MKTISYTTIDRTGWSAGPWSLAKQLSDLAS